MSHGTLLWNKRTVSIDCDPAMLTTTITLTVPFKVTPTNTPYETDVLRNHLLFAVGGQLLKLNGGKQIRGKFKDDRIKSQWSDWHHSQNEYEIVFETIERKTVEFFQDKVGHVV